MVRFTKRVHQRGLVCSSKSTFRVTMAYRNNSIVDGPGSGNPDDPYDFEKGRIRALRDEHLYIQKKTFTKWVNSFLIKCRIEVGNLNFQTLFEKLPFLAISFILLFIHFKAESTKGQFL